MKTTVIYHRADFDGIFCREIARKFLPDAELIGWHYGDPLVPYPMEGTVYVLDLSPECLDTMPPGCQSNLVWIDHHKSTIEKWPASTPGYRIDGVAACRLTWQFFTEFAQQARFPKKEEYINRTVTEPLAVRLAGEYDILDKRDPRADLFQHGLRSCDLGPRWDGLLANRVGEVEDLLARGEAIQYAQTEQNKDIITSYGFALDFEGLHFLACNHARYNSHLFAAGLKPEHDACFGFKWTGKTWEISLYHAPGKEHHDLSKIAVKFGGGGHRGACGFRLKKLPFTH